MIELDEEMNLGREAGEMRVGVSGRVVQEKAPLSTSRGFIMSSVPFLRWRCSLSSFIVLLAKGVC